MFEFCKLGENGIDDVAEWRAGDRDNGIEKSDLISVRIISCTVDSFRNTNFVYSQSCDDMEEVWGVVKGDSPIAKNEIRTKRRLKEEKTKKNVFANLESWSFMSAKGAIFN